MLHLHLIPLEVLFATIVKLIKNTALLGRGRERGEREERREREERQGRGKRDQE